MQCVKIRFQHWTAFVTFMHLMKLTVKKILSFFPIPVGFLPKQTRTGTGFVLFCFVFVLFLFCFLWRCGPTRAMASSVLRFLDHTQRRITVGKTPLYKWSARRRDLYLTTHNTHNKQTSMHPVGFEPTISASERPQTARLLRPAHGLGRNGKLTLEQTLKAQRGVQIQLLFFL